MQKMVEALTEAINMVVSGEVVGIVVAEVSNDSTRVAESGERSAVMDARNAIGRLE